MVRSSATRALKAPLKSYGCLGRDWHRNRGFFSGLVRGVSNLREASKILAFLFRSRLVCNSLLHLLSSQRDCPKSPRGVHNSALWAIETALFGPFWPPNTGQSYAQSVDSTLFGQAQKVDSRKFDLAKAAAPCLHFLPCGRLLSGADRLPAPPPASPLPLLSTSSVVWS
jgi:hypothetical protein